MKFNRCCLLLLENIFDSSKSYINVEEKSDKGWWNSCNSSWWLSMLFNKSYWWQQWWLECYHIQVQIMLPATIENWCYFLVKSHQCRKSLMRLIDRYCFEFRCTSEVVSWWGCSHTSWHLLMMGSLTLLHGITSYWSTEEIIIHARLISPFKAQKSNSEIGTCKVCEFA